MIWIVYWFHVNENKLFGIFVISVDISTLNHQAFDIQNVDEINGRFQDLLDRQTLLRPK